ncbi:hypothetical protein [Enterococcus cecorum]|uniref:hypothetical protein n=1 Tax=Enterococcus cecorum TaxID=44008 RepID=UPI000643DE0C|nr:hypothetical protein [Enterococcus cecorum]KLO73817.1 hypothetical protein AA989_06050 [Enterococcus cecorum]
MKLIDVLVKQCKGEIRKGTKLIIDFSYEQDSPETYTYDGERFINESNYQWHEDYGASVETLNAEVKLIEPPLYYCKMPNSKRVLGVHNNLIFFELLRNIKQYNSTVFLFTQDEIESLDILAPYRNFEWSEYRESMDS